MSQENKTLAKAIIETANMYERSFDHTAADNADRAGSRCIDYSRFYMKSILGCAKEVSPDFAVPIHLMLRATWNDAIAWAQSILSEEGN